MSDVRGFSLVTFNSPLEFHPKILSVPENVSKCLKLIENLHNFVIYHPQSFFVIKNTIFNPFIKSFLRPFDKISSTFPKSFISFV